MCWVARLMCLAAAVMFLTSSPASAWGHQGHEAVGAIAEQLIAGSPAGDAAKKLLGGNWALSQAAIWADCAKGVHPQQDGTFRYSVAVDKDGKPLFPECGVFETPDEKAHMEDYVSKNWTQCGDASATQHCHEQYHYTDVAIQRDHYQALFAGTNKHDVVHAINAAIAELKGEKVPSPFYIPNKTIALMLLAHYVGDIHQPLHVGAIYLDALGHPADPDGHGFDPATVTDGGNQMQEGPNKKNFHAEWDAIPSALMVGGERFTDEVAAARAVPQTDGEAGFWSTRWAGESIIAAGDAFRGLTFSAKTRDGWPVSGVNDDYTKHADDLKAEQLAKAGARLAQVLKYVWPDQSIAQPGKQMDPDPIACVPLNKSPYLISYPNPDVWLPKTPTSTFDLDSLANVDARGKPSDVVAMLHRSNQTADDLGVDLYQDALIKHTERADQAAHDDVFPPWQIAQRFNQRLGIDLSCDNSPALMQLLYRAESDAGAFLNSVKLPVDRGGRLRPFVADRSRTTCIEPIDIAGRRFNDEVNYPLDQSGSYPSTHAFMGMFIGLLFTEIAPDRSQDMMAWGLDFGESRVVCAFHYPSDVAAGRVAAAVLWSRLHSQEKACPTGKRKNYSALSPECQFADDLAKARKEVDLAQHRTSH